MRALIICVVTMLLVSCHTTKHTTTDVAVKTNTESVKQQELFISTLDSLRTNLDFSADSIVISIPNVIKINDKDSVVRTTISIINPHINKQKEQKHQNVTNNSLKLKTYTSKDSIAQVKENTEKVVVSEPFNWLWLVGIGVVLIFGWIGIRWVRKQIDYI